VDFKKNGSVFLFNLVCSAIWCLCLLIANGFKLHLDGDVLLWGAIYGVTQALFILFKAKAMNEGAVYLTTLIGNCSLIISVFACFVIWNEPVSLSDAVGLCVLIVAIFLTTYRKSKSHLAKKWFVYALFFLIFGAAVGLVFKAFSKSGSEHAEDMMVIASAVMITVYSIICIINGDFKKNLPMLVHNRFKTFVITALVAGVLSCAYNRLNIYLSGELIGAIFFPCFNGGVVVLSTLLGVVLLREKPNVMQFVGIALGIIGICIIGNL
jgi:drug/metabolite transporter (DMT)-like permease